MCIYLCKNIYYKEEIMKKSKSKLITGTLLSMMIIASLMLTGCEEKMTTIGMTQIVDHPSLNQCRQGVIDALAAAGYIEGENIAFDYQNAQGETTNASAIAQQFVSDNVDVILAISTPSAQSAYAAAIEKEIPVVFSAITDPVAAEIAAEDGSSLPFITGTSDEMPLPESFKLINALTPEATKVGILHSTSEVNSDVQLAQAREIAGDYGVEIIDMGITTTNEIASALDALLPQVDVMLNLTDNTIVSSMPLIAERCAEAGIPIYGSEDTQVPIGALASAGIDYYQLGLQTGEMIVKILEGESCENIEIERISEAMVTINTDVATELGIEIPESYSNAIFVTTEGE
jgi:putative ABC transport system substrate-binding protein